MGGDLAHIAGKKIHLVLFLRKFKGFFLNLAFPLGWMVALVVKGPVVVIKIKQELVVFLELVQPLVGNGFLFLQMD